MKHLLIFSIAMHSISFSFGQIDTDSLPLKNGMIYFSFSHDMGNSQNCLNHYFSNGGMNQYDFSKKLMEKISEFTQSQSNLLLNKNYTFFGSISPACEGGSAICTCMDTTMNAEVMLGVPTKIRVTPLFGLAKKKILSQSIVGKVQLVMHSKSSYTINIRGFTYKCTTYKAGKTINEEHPLEDLYLDNLKSTSSSLAQKNIYSDLNKFMNQFDIIIEETFVEMIKVDELD
ncbi:MAG: hypothetical protein IPM74_16490 [Crocinitomicaceae bacterium]|nr:hypothetical protein [Crocinitomicaceae bacterium]MBK8927449.1 hypothetical protein [Crocinitomicaceae bacterium]